MLRLLNQGQIRSKSHAMQNILSITGDTVDDQSCIDILASLQSACRLPMKLAIRSDIFSTAQQISKK